MEVSIIFIDGQVKHIKSPILFELRHLGAGYDEYTQEEIEKARAEKRILICIRGDKIECTYCPSGVTCIVNDSPIASSFQ